MPDPARDHGAPNGSKAPPSLPTCVLRAARSPWLALRQKVIYDLFPRGAPPSRSNPVDAKHLARLLSSGCAPRGSKPCTILMCTASSPRGLRRSDAWCIHGTRSSCCHGAEPCLSWEICRRLRRAFRVSGCHSRPLQHLPSPGVPRLSARLFARLVRVRQTTLRAAPRIAVLPRALHAPRGLSIIESSTSRTTRHLQWKDYGTAVSAHHAIVPSNFCGRFFCLLPKGSSASASLVFLALDGARTTYQCRAACDLRFSCDHYSPPSQGPSLRCWPCRIVAGDRWSNDSRRPRSTSRRAEMILLTLVIDTLLDSVDSSPLARPTPRCRARIHAHHRVDSRVCAPQARGVSSPITTPLRDPRCVLLAVLARFNTHNLPRPPKRRGFVQTALSIDWRPGALLHARLRASHSDTVYRYRT